MPIETSYIRDISAVGQKMPYLLSVNTEQYALFALKTYIWPFLFEGEIPSIRSIEKDDKMVYVIDIYKGEIEQTISKKRANLIKSFVDRFTILHPSNMYCRVFNYSNCEKDIVKNWVYPPDIPMKFEDGYVYANLYEVPDYAFMYDQINISLYQTCNQ